MAGVGVGFRVKSGRHPEKTDMNARETVVELLRQ